MYHVEDRGDEVELVIDDTSVEAVLGEALLAVSYDRVELGRLEDGAWSARVVLDE